MGRRWWGGPGLGRRPGPSYFRVMGPGPVQHIDYLGMDRGPAWPMVFSEDEPRPCRPIKFQLFPARSMAFHIFMARPVISAERPMGHGPYMIRPATSVGWSVDSKGRPMGRLTTSEKLFLSRIKAFQE